MHWLTSKPKQVLVGLLIATAVLHFAGLFARGVRPRLIRGDAVHYYVWVHSAVIDRDLDFSNDYNGLYGLDFTNTPPPPGFPAVYERTVTGHVRNVMAVGTPILWSPLFVMFAAAGWGASALGLAAPPTGFELPFQLIPDIVGLGAVGLALWFAFLIARDLHGGKAALQSATAMFAGGSLLYYGLVSPSYSHAVSAMVASGFFYYWWRTRDDDAIARYAKIGALAGAVALVRWQDGILLGAVALDVVAHWRARRGTREGFLPFALPRLFVAGVGSLVVFTPQMYGWMTIYGHPLLVPQGGDFMRWLSPHPLDTLFSPLRGLISWTPLAALGIAGLVPLYRKNARAAILMGTFFVASLYINAAVVDWWAGEAFGARRFLSCFAPLAIGLSSWLALPGRGGTVARVVTALAVVANLFLFVHYEAFMLGATKLAPYPDNWYTLWIDRWAVPFRVVLALVFKSGGAA